MNMRWRAGREDRWAGRLVDGVPIYTGGGRVGVVDDMFILRTFLNIFFFQQY